MLFKKHLANVYIQLKTTGKMFFVPLVVLFVVLPTIFVLSYMREGIEGLQTTTTIIGNIFIPLFSVWWILMVLREYIESNGNELLFVYDSKSQIVSVVYILLLYIFCTGILYAICAFKLPTAGLDFIHVSLVSVMYAGFAYAFVFLTRSLAITFVPFLIYSVLSFMRPAIIGFTTEISWREILIKYFPQFVLGIVFLLVGHILNKKFLKFH